MALMAGSLYDALRSVNVDEDRARKAAEEVAGFDARANSLDKDMAAIRGDIALMKWMLGFVLATNAAILLRIFA